MRETMRRRFVVINNAFYELLPQARQDAAFISGNQWPWHVFDEPK